MNAKNLTIGGALVLLAVTLIGRFEGLISDQMLLWAAMILGMVVGAYVFAIGATEYFKRVNFTQDEIECINDPHSDKCDKEKRRTHKAAVRFGFVGMAICGVIFILLEGATWKIKVVIGVFWIFLSMIVAVTTPLIWRLLRKRFIKAADEIGNEALDRPSEKPE